MSNKKRKFQGGIRIKPNTSGLADDGDITVDSADNKLKTKLAGADRSVVTEDQDQTVSNKTLDGSNTVEKSQINADDTKFTIKDNADDTKKIDFDAGGTTGTKTTIAASQTVNRTVTLPDADDTLVGKDTIDTLTNKIIDSASNTLTVDADEATVENIEVGNFKASAIVTKVEGIASNDNDITLPTSAAVKDYVDSQILTKDEASEIGFDDTSPDVTGTDVQAAVDYVANRAAANTRDIEDLQSLSGSSGDVDHGTFTGSTIPDNSTTKEALQALETQAESVANSAATAQSTVNDHIANTVDAHDASAISNTPSGNLAATDVQAALNELQTDIDTRATSADLTSHTGATSAHGVSGDLVGTSDAQTLTNKSIESPSRLDPKKDTEANLITYAATAQNGELVYATDTKKFYVVTDGALTEVGGTGGTGGAAGTSININETAHGFVVGDGVYHNGTNWLKAQANNGTTLAQFVVTEVTDVDNVVAYQFGQVEITSHGFTVGEYYFLSADVAGTPTATEPASGFSCPLFYVLDANNLIINVYRPSSIGVTGSAGGAGDADTIHLIRANSDDIDIVTQFSVDSTLPDFDGTTAFGADEGDISVPTSGSEALLSNENDHKVYKFSSEASSQYSAWGMNFAIPRYVRGKDVVLQFKYRTADTSGDSQNADYMPWVFNQTNGVNTTFNDTPGTFTAGSSIVLTSTAGMAVGDKIWVGEAASVVETHITAIPVAGTVQLADDVTCAAGARFITGILTDVLTTLDAADDDTNKTGTDYKVVFKVPDTCAEVTIMWQQLTSQTDSFLYVDNILVSSEVVKRVFARGQSEEYRTSGALGYGSTNTKIPYFQSTPDKNTLSKLGTVENDSTNGFSFTALRRCKVHMSVSIAANASGIWTGITLNSDQLTTDIYLITDASQVVTIGYGTTATTPAHVSATLILNKGDVLRPHGNSPALFADDEEHAISIVATPEVNDVVVVESTDSVKGYFAQATAADTYNVGSAAKLNLNADVSDDFSMVDLTNDRINILRDGIYKLGFYGSTPFGFANWVAMSYKVNGGTAQTLGALVPTSSSGHQANNERTVELNAGDYVDFWIQNGAAVNTTSITVTVEEAVVTADYQPLLSFPTITYGQDAEFYGMSAATTNFWDATGNTYNFDISLIPLTGSNLVEWNDTTQTRLVAKQRIILDVAIESNQYAGNAVRIYKSDGTSPAFSYETANDYSVTANYKTILDAGDYIYFRGENVFNRAGSIQILAQPEEGQQNAAAIIAQPVAYVKHVLPASSDGGTATSGTWQDRPLNTLAGDIAAVGVSLASNIFTLPPGKYEIEAGAMFKGTNRTKLLLANNTDNIGYPEGMCNFFDSTYNVQGEATLKRNITITKETDFKLRYYVQTAVATNGLGIGTGNGTGEETFAVVKITRKK